MNKGNLDAQKIFKNFIFKIYHFFHSLLPPTTTSNCCSKFFAHLQSAETVTNLAGVHPIIIRFYSIVDNDMLGLHDLYVNFVYITKLFLRTPLMAVKMSWLPSIGCNSIYCECNESFSKFLFSHLSSK